MRNIEILTLLPFIRFEREKNETLYLNSRKSGQVAHRLDDDDLCSNSDAGQYQSSVTIHSRLYRQDI